MKGLFIVALFIMIIAGCARPDAWHGKASFSHDELDAKMKEDKRKRAFPEPERFTASDGVRLAYYPYFKDNKSAGVIVFHGGGAHATGAYQYLAEGLFGKYGINVFLFDTRGHGKSDGRRGDTPTPERVYQDVNEIISHVRAITGGRVFVIGHSSGGGMLLNYLSWKEKNKVGGDEASGYIFLSPEFGYKSNTARKDRTEFARIRRSVFVIAGITKGRIGGNWYAVFFNYPPEVLGRDPLMVDRITRNMSAALTPDDPVRQFAGIRRPFAIFIGSKDELMDPVKVVSYAAYAPFKVRQESTAAILEGAGHLSAIWRSDDRIGAILERWMREKAK